MYRPYGNSVANSSSLLDVESIIRGLTQDYCTAFNTGNYDQLSALFASDGLFMPPNHEPAQGPRAIEWLLREYGENGYQDLRLETRLQIDNSVTWPFLSILVSWTALLFFGFGLLARLNAAAVFTLAIGALSVASAIFLILELDAPYSGMLRLPPTPILQAIDALAK